MKTEVFSLYSDKDLYEKLHVLRIQIFNYMINKRFQAKSDLRKVRLAKKSVARILTVIAGRKVLGC